MFHLSSLYVCVLTVLNNNNNNNTNHNNNSYEAIKRCKSVFLEHYTSVLSATQHKLVYIIIRVLYIRMYIRVMCVCVCVYV